MKKRWMAWGVIGAAASLAACGGGGKGAPAQGPPVKVTLVRAAEADLPSPEAYVGNVRSKRAVVISTKMMGRVQRIAVEEGQVVRKGQILVEVDAAEARGAYRQSSAGVGSAEVAVRNAERDLARYKALYEQKAVTARQLEQAEMGAATARAQKAQAEAGLGMSDTLLSYGRIVAPQDGVVTRKWMDPGNLAYPGAPILTLEDPAELELSVQVPEGKARALTVGQKALVTVDALGKSFEAGLSAVVGAADPVSRTSLVKLAIPAGPGILPGQFATVRFAAFSQRALTVPAAALVERGQMDAVFVAEAGVARQRYIQTGLRSGEHVQVLAGLREGEPVVAPVPGGLSDGARVEAAP